MEVTYSLSGKDDAPSLPAATEMPLDPSGIEIDEELFQDVDTTVTEEEEELMPSLPPREPETLPARESEGPPATKRRRPRQITKGSAVGVEGRLDAGLTLSERLDVINRTLNKDYLHKRGGETKYGKISLWPITLCTTLDGYIRQVHANHILITYPHA